MSRRNRASTDAIDPKILSKLKGEDQFIQSEQRTTRRVKVERGKIWVVRFLPARLGPDDMWFARIARHWLNGKPVVCPRTTAEDFGGNPKTDCPICEISDELNASSDQAVSKFGYSVRATPQWTTFCVVFEKDDVEQPLAEVLQPYQFDHYKSTWEELKAFYLSNASEKNRESILSYELGNDFSVSRTGKGMRLDKMESQPIFPDDERKVQKYIEKIEAAIHAPKVTIPTDAELRAFKIKVEDAAQKIEDGEEAGKSRGRRAAMEEEDPDESVKPSARARTRRDPEPEEAPKTSRRAPEPEEEAPRSRRSREPEPEAEEAPRSRRTAREPEPDPDADDDVPYDEPPARSSRRSSVRTQDDAEDPDASEPEAEIDDVDEAEIDPEVEAEVDPEVEADDPDADAEPEEAPRRARGKLPPPPAAVAKSGRRSRDEIEEDDNVTDEENDPAPARPVRQRGDDIEEDPDDDVPPVTSRKGSEGLKSKIASMRKKR